MVRGRRKMVVAVLALVVVASLVTGCRVSKIGAKCAGGEMGRDNVGALVCVKGRFFRGPTYGFMLEQLRELQRRPLSGVWEVATGYGYTCALINDGTVKCWGMGFADTLGTPNTFVRPAPEAVPTIEGATDIDAFSNHTCAIVTGGAVRCWGTNWNGQLGNGTEGETEVPVGVVGLTGATDIAVGWGHSCAIVADGEVRCWGLNRSGQLGDGTSNDRSTPVAVDGLSGAVSLAAGLDHTCALLDDATVVCWGANESGQLGDDSGDGRYRRWWEFVPGLFDGDVTSIAAGVASTCATMSTGELRCWGAAGEIGTGGSEDQWGPVVVPGVGGAVRSSSGYLDNACAITHWGAGVSCWGSNQVGQLGDLSRTARSTPGAVYDVGAVVRLDVGADHSCAVLLDTTLKCWGDNTSGEATGTYTYTAGRGVDPTIVTELPPRA